MSFSHRVEHYQDRVARQLDAVLPSAGEPPGRLHEAMRYAVFNGGKRVRPLLTYATGECIGVDERLLDAPAAAIELVHAFSLVHDDLPAMDDDDLRRGLPTVHRKFDEATAILAADALQPLAFSVLASASAVPEAVRVRLVSLLADACGSLGMTGGQAIDLASEGKSLEKQALETMYTQKTGALIHASVVSACLISSDLTAQKALALDRFARSTGVAFQIRDDILDVEGETEVIGKPAGSDISRGKATYPGLFGVDQAQRRLRQLVDNAHAELDAFGADAEPLRWLAHYMVDRAS